MGLTTWRVSVFWLRFMPRASFIFANPEAEIDDLLRVMPGQPPDIRGPGNRFFVVLVDGRAGFYSSMQELLPGKQKVWQGAKALSTAFIGCDAIRE